MHSRYYFPALTITFILFSLLGVATSVRAETSHPFLTPLVKSAQTVLEDTKSILTAPGQWGRAEWARAGLVAGTTLRLFESDQQLREYFQDRHTRPGDDFSGMLERVGNPAYLAPALGLWYLYGRAAGDCQTQQVAWLSLESVVISGGITGVLKGAFQRSRPYAATGPRDFSGPDGTWADERLSFPSMHSAAAFAAATVLAESYQKQRWVAYLAYGSATLVAWSRVYDDQHWSSDVFLGAAVGCYTARKLLARRREKTPENVEPEAISITPIAVPGGVALAAQYRF